MGPDDILVTGARVAGDMSGDADLGRILQIGAHVAVRLINPNILVTDAINFVGDRVVDLIVKDGMEPGSQVYNDIQFFQNGMDGVDLNLLGIQISRDDVIFGGLNLVTSGALGAAIDNGRDIGDARDLIGDHREMIRGMAERGVPGFAHEIIFNRHGTPKEVFVQVPLDGGEPVTYVESYDGPIPLMGRTMHNADAMRDTLIAETADGLEHWAIRADSEAQSRLEAEGMRGPDAAQAAQLAVDITYQQLKATAITDIVSDAGVTPRIAPSFTVAAGAPVEAPAAQPVQRGPSAAFTDAFGDMTP